MKQNSILASIVIAVLAFTTSSPVLGSTSAQAPVEDLTVTATITDSLGVPWPTEVKLMVTVTNNAQFVTACPKVVPNSLGKVSFTISIESGILDGSAVELEIMGTPSPLFLTGPGAFFLNPIVGEACIHSGIKPEYDAASNGYIADFKTSSISPPPLYGSLLLNSQFGQQLSLKVMDFDPTGVLDSEFFALGCFEQPIPLTQSTIDLYRWNLSSASWVSVYGPNGSSLAHGILRRGSTLSLIPSKEVNVNISIDQSVYPSSQRVLIVRAADHVPNAQSPIGSDIDFFHQRQRAVSSRPLKAHLQTAPTGIEVVDFHMSGGNFVAELWSAPSNYSAPDTMTLLDYQAFTSPTDDQIIILD